MRYQGMTRPIGSARYSGRDPQEVKRILRMVKDDLFTTQIVLDQMNKRKVFGEHKLSEAQEVVEKAIKFKLVEQRPEGYKIVKQV